MGLLAEIQEQLKPWTAHNFGDVPSWHPLLGMQEELGELSHSYLKREQGIRGTAGAHRVAMIDAIGDILIYALDFCNREEIDAESILELTWQQVRQRDWKANPDTGGAS